MTLAVTGITGKGTEPTSKINCCKKSGQYDTFVQCRFEVDGVSEQIHTDCSVHKKASVGLCLLFEKSLYSVSGT